MHGKHIKKLEIYRVKVERTPEPHIELSKLNEFYCYASVCNSIHMYWLWIMSVNVVCNRNFLQIDAHCLEPIITLIWILCRFFLIFRIKQSEIVWCWFLHCVNSKFVCALLNTKIDFKKMTNVRTAVRWRPPTESNKEVAITKVSSNVSIQF